MCNRIGVPLGIVCIARCAVLCVGRIVLIAKHLFHVCASALASLLFLCLHAIHKGVFCFVDVGNIVVLKTLELFG